MALLRRSIPCAHEAEGVAFVVEHAHILLNPTIQRQTYLPRPCEYLRIFDGRLIADVVRGDRRIALDDVQRLAVKVAGAIEPRLVGEVDHINDERVPLPASP